MRKYEYLGKRRTYTDRYDLEFNPPQGILERLAVEIDLDFNDFNNEKFVSETDAEEIMNEKKRLIDFEF